MTENPLESEQASANEGQKQSTSGWLKLGLAAAVTALAGGVAAAWWYRKTLTKLHENGETIKNPHFGSPVDEELDL